MTLRSATTEDLDAIMALERASFPTDAWSDAMMRDELASRHNWYIVDDEGGDVVGYAGLRAPRGSKDADVQTIAIAEAARGRGLGRGILTALLEEAARRRVREVFLEVRADSPIPQALYASEGFVELGRRPHYYQPDDIDAVVMRLRVREWQSGRRGRTEQVRTEGGRGEGVGGTPQKPTSAADNGPDSAESVDSCGVLQDGPTGTGADTDTIAGENT